MSRPAFTPPVLKSKSKPASIVPGASSLVVGDVDDERDVSMTDGQSEGAADTSLFKQQDAESSHAQDDQGDTTLQELEDPNLLASYPIYLSHSLPSSSSLQLFQYPTYPSRAPLPLPNYSRERGLNHAIRWRPKAGWVQVELPLDLRVSLYHKEKGETMAKGANKMGGQIGSGPRSHKDVDDDDDTVSSLRRKRGQNGGSRMRDDSDEEMDGGNESKALPTKLEKMRLESEVMPHMTKYCVGVMRDQALHLTQLDRILQLRPSMHHLDGLDAIEAEDKRNAAKLMASEQTLNEAESGETSQPHLAAAVKKEKKTAHNVGVKVGGTVGGGGGGGGGGFGGRGQSDGTGYDARDALMASKRRAEGETWIELEWRDLHGSDVCRAEVQTTISSQLFAGSKTKLKCKTKPRDYLPVSAAIESQR